MMSPIPQKMNNTARTEGNRAGPGYPLSSEGKLWTCHSTTAEKMIRNSPMAVLLTLIAVLLCHIGFYFNTLLKNAD
jgi:hypothetical protein